MAPWRPTAIIAVRMASMSKPLPLETARVLVTGGAGFIGSYLVPSLLERGATVLVIDDLSRGRKEHLRDLATDGRLGLHVGDVRDPGTARKAAEFEPDACFHLAAIHFIPYCVSHPQETLDVNVLGFDRILRALRDAPVRSVVYTSSAAVYGYGDVPHTERTPTRPGDIHGISKWMCEEVLKGFSEDRPDVHCSAARLFNVYGPRETNAHVIPAITRAYARDEMVRIGNLWPKRDYVFAQDVADALIAVSDGPAGWDAFNVGTGKGTSVGELLETIGDITGRSVRYEQVPELTRSDDGHLVSNNRKIVLEAGWEPRFDVEAGLREVLAWANLLSSDERAPIPSVGELRS
jgi:UDP-glucose 4-epimerase